MTETIRASCAAGRTVKQARLGEEVFDQRAVETRRSFPPQFGEYEIVRFGCFADHFDSFEIRGHVVRGDKLSELSLAAHVETYERAAMLVCPGVNVAPTEIAGLHRSHARIGHDEHEVVGHVPVPGIPI